MTLILIAGMIVTAATVVAVTVRAYETVPVLAGETTVVGLADSAAETLAGNQGPLSPSRNDWSLTTVSELNEAEDLLDALENQGYSERELVVLGNSCFGVRWR